MKFVKKGDKLEEGVMMPRDTVDARGRKKGCFYTISYVIV